eukprot:14085790-Alexandrium_andersonii.AAC.1
MRATLSANSRAEWSSRETRCGVLITTTSFSGLAQQPCGHGCSQGCRLGVALPRQPGGASRRHSGVHPGEARWCPHL